MVDPHPPSTPAIRLEQAQTCDFDEQAGLLVGWHQNYAQLSSGAFQGEIAELRFDDIHLFAESTSCALFQSGQLDDATLAVGIPLQAAQRGLFCGAFMEASSAHVFSGTAGFEFFSPARLTMGGLAMPRHSLLARLPAAQQALVLENSVQPHLLRTTPDAMLEARAFLHQAFQLCRRSAALLESENFRNRLREAALACAADVLIGPQESSLILHRRWQIVRQAQDHLNAMSDTPVSIESLCLELGVSRRTLQYCFQDTLGINPVAFLRAQRLNGVRRMLKARHSVTDAATAWGFWHFGHFSQEYKKLFGELPSDTLKRRQG